MGSWLHLQTFERIDPEAESFGRHRSAPGTAEVLARIHEVIAKFFEER